MLTEDFTVEIERLSKGKWKGVHRPGRHGRSELRSPWVRRSALAAIGAAALMIFPLALDTMEKPQFVAPLSLGTVPDTQLKAPYVEPMEPRVIEPITPNIPAKPPAVSIPVVVSIKKPPLTEDSSAPVPDPVTEPVPPTPPPFEEPTEPVPPSPPPVDLPEPVPTPPTVPPPSDEDHHHRCHCKKKCKEPDPEETNDGEQGQQETPEEDDQHSGEGTTPPVVDPGTGTEEAAPGSERTEA